MKKQLFSWVLTAGITLLSSQTLPAHTINYTLASLPQTDIWQTYFKLGFDHILPLGIDHILFILSVFFLSADLKNVFRQSIAFTLAHSVTMALAMNGYIRPAPAIVEPIIALSIFFVAAENLITRKLRPTRLLIVFGFGLIHGMGFAGALGEIGLPPGSYTQALLAFNIGVELGQLAVIVLAYWLTTHWFSNRPWYQSRIVQPLCASFALIALYWTIERTFS